MSLPKDPIMLMSVINTKLRDQYASLDDLCEDLDEDKAEIIATLKAIGINYNETTNSFR